MHETAGSKWNPAEKDETTFYLRNLAEYFISWWLKHPLGGNAGDYNNDDLMSHKYT